LYRSLRIPPRFLTTQVRGKLEITVADMGEQDLKNIARPLHTYRVIL
jgi:hypothetical protein